MHEIWAIPDEPMTKESLPPLNEKPASSEPTKEASPEEVGGWAE